MLFFLCILPLLSPSAAAADLDALLAFKYAVSADPFRALASWTNSTPYCQWRGMTCSPRHPGRITSLNLDSLNLTGTLPAALAALSFLQTLSLPYNELHGDIPPELFHLRRLQVLNLSSNSLQGSIPGSFSRRPTIKVVDLKGNRLQGEVPATFSLCRNLQILRLSSNQLTGTIPAELGSLQRLTYLDLGSNKLDGAIPPSLGNLSSLSAIDLSQNSLSGGIPATFGRLTSLAFLYLYRNSLTGDIPSLNNLSSLMYLDLSYNNLTGGLSPAIANLSSLVSVDLTINMLSGAIPAWLGECRYLSKLYLTGNSFSGPIPASLGSLPALAGLGLSHNELTGTIPSSFYNLTTLQGLGLANNQLVGTLPDDFGDRFPNLQGLALYYNLFHGPIPASLTNASMLTDIELTGNSFGGKIPANFGKLKDLSWLSLDRNLFDASDADGWDFVASLANCSALISLGVDYNSMGGVLPESVANLSTELQWLALGGNGAHGQIPADIGNLVGLNVLGMDQNLLTGGIPASISNLPMLQELYLSDNKFSGRILASLGNLTKLNKLGLAGSALEGSIPPTIGNLQALRWLNLSLNQLTGEIPEEVISIASLTEFMDLSRNSLTGPLPEEISRLKNLAELYLSDNELSGEIPGSIGECQLLNVLHLDGNRFQGAIPATMSNLKGLQELDFSRNNLSGPIPTFLQSFRFLKLLNLSSNNLDGEVPMAGIFRNSSAFSVMGNSDLCGGNPELGLRACARGGGGGGGNRSNGVRVIMIATIVPLASLLLLCFLVFWYCSHNRRRESATRDSRMEEGHPMKKVTFSEICRATDEFSPANLIGMGSFGSVYKGTMNLGEENVVAIKVLNLRRRGASKSFVAECDALRCVRHRNLVKILTSCSTLDHKGEDFKALVFEYMSNGSLEEWLHPEKGGEEREERRALSLRQRLDIAIDVASALDYLHNHGPTQIVHSDLKPSNILLDRDMVAHVGDFGLAKLAAKMVDKSSKSSIGVKGTVGYVAPEYGMANKVSTQGDVYSYGILLLEMFTGIRPTDESLKEGLNLHKFVDEALPAAVMEIADKTLLVQAEEDAASHREMECLVSVLRVGLSCSRESPKERLQMGEVSREMQAARARLGGDGVRREVNSVKDQIRPEEGPSYASHYEKSGVSE